jgi:hypothetical protein
MKSNRYSSDPISPVSFTMLASVAETAPSLDPQGTEQIVEQVVFEVEFVKIFNDRAIGKIWFLGTSAQENVKQGEGVVIIPIQPDTDRKEFAIQGHEASVVANTYSDFGDVIAVVQGMLTIESLSTDDTAIKTGFGRIMVSRISLNHEKMCPRNNTESVSFVH